MNKFKKIIISKVSQGIALLLILFVVPAYSSPSDIKPIGASTKYHYVAGGPDILITAPKNAAGISINNFNSFQVWNNTLFIYNGQRQLGDSVTNDAADIIVISSPVIGLSSKIEIIGKPADLIFITSSDKLTSSSDFTNANRVTMVNGTYNDPVNIGDITTRPGGEIFISTLNAPGLQSLELIAEHITTNSIDINLAANNHSAGGMMITDDGDYVVGSGGVNFYAGQFIIGYHELDIIRRNTDTGHSTEPALTINGSIKAATIAITGSGDNEIIIAQDAELNTTNDTLSSSMVNGELYIPIEGVYITAFYTYVSSYTAVLSEPITINGTIITDNEFSLKTFGDSTLSTTSTIIAKDISLIAKNKISTDGLIQTTNFEASAKYFFNTANITANEVNIEVDTSITNHRGGDIRANKITLKTDIFGKVTNGSVSQSSTYTAPDSLSPRVDLTTTQWGVRLYVQETGFPVTNLSANLLANEIYIDTGYFENINPYWLPKSANDAWDTGISINSDQTNRVSVQAEKTLHIKARAYVLNSSAILGLNQAGEFQMDTRLFSNERYYLTTDLLRFTQLIYSSDTSIQEDKATGAFGTIIKYSPPGRVYSFGDFKFANGFSDTKAEFINEFSYVEFFQNAYFDDAELRILGLEIAATGVDISATRNCIVYGRCDSDQTKTSIEAETLFSIKGNLFGVDETTLSKTDAVVDVIQVYEQQVLAKINNFLTPYIYDYRGIWDANWHSYLVDLNIGADTFTAIIVACFNAVGTECDDEKTVTVTHGIDELLSPAFPDNLFGYTAGQLETAARAYLVPYERVDNLYSLDPPYKYQAERFLYISEVLNSSSPALNITYINTHGRIKKSGWWVHDVTKNEVVTVTVFVSNDNGLPKITGDVVL